jgi:DnaJ-class molecular chaperone
VNPKQRLAQLARERGDDPRAPDDLHKAAQEARLVEEVRRPHRAATHMLSARGKAKCLLCDGKGSVYSEPDICGDEWLESCSGCGGTGEVVTR